MRAVPIGRAADTKPVRGRLQAVVEGVPLRSGAHLVLAGPSPSGVTDDPDGAVTLAALQSAWRGLRPCDRKRVHVASLPMHDVHENAAIVNALQRRTAVVVQESLAEGFGLTVPEALSKGRPVVASDIGRIRAQVTHLEDRLLVDDPRDLGAFGGEIRALFSDPILARHLGSRGNQTVLERFPAPHDIQRNLSLIVTSIVRG